MDKKLWNKHIHLIIISIEKLSWERTSLSLPMITIRQTSSATNVGHYEEAVPSLGTGRARGDNSCVMIQRKTELIIGDLPTVKNKFRVSNFNLRIAWKFHRSAIANRKYRE